MIQWLAYVVLPDGNLYENPSVCFQFDYRGKFLCYQGSCGFHAMDLSFLTDDGSSQ